MRTFEHGGNVHSLQRSASKPLIDFSANINSLGLASSVRQAIAESIDEIIHYPDADGTLLKRSIADHYELPYGAITLGNGAVELLYVLCHLLRPRRVLIPSPSFSEYERAATAVGAESTHYILSPEDGFAIDPCRLAESLSGYDMVFIGNPNNPTGMLLTVIGLQTIIAVAEACGTWVIVDESFIDFLDDCEYYTAKPLLDKYSKLIVLHSLTKFYAIPGLRLGFAASNADLAQRLHCAKDQWNVNHLAQVAGVAALGDMDYQSTARLQLLQERDAMVINLGKYTNLKIFSPTVNFVLVDIAATGLTSAQLTAKCFEEGLLIRNCANYPGLTDDYVRFAIKATADNERLYAVLDNIIGGRKG